MDDRNRMIRVICVLGLFIGLFSCRKSDIDWRVVDFNRDIQVEEKKYSVSCWYKISKQSDNIKYCPILVQPIKSSHKGKAIQRRDLLILNGKEYPARRNQNKIIYMSINGETHYVYEIFYFKQDDLRNEVSLKKLVLRMLQAHEEKGRCE